jgi:uncharacterized protein YfaS (alpha-2-macroglobulin family)
MKRWIIFAVVAATARTYAGGAGTIEGSVVDASGAALAGKVRIEITCGTVHRTANIDGSGHFSVSGLPEGTCTVTGTGAGFAAQSFMVTVSSGAIATLLFTMSPPLPPAPPPMAMPAAAPRPEPMPPMEKPAEPRKQPMRKLDAKPIGGGGGAAAKAPPPPPPPPKVLVDGNNRPVRMRARDFQVAANKEIAGGDAIAGWAPVRVFPVPQYPAHYDGPRTDFRETIYWNPSVDTNADGDADVTFATSDAVTSFRATVEGFAAGGTPGAGTLAIQSKLPVTLDAHLPLEVSSGDAIQLPVTIANETETPVDAELTAKFGAAFRLAQTPSGKLHLAAGGKQTVVFPITVVATDGSADVELALAARGLTDQLKKTIRVVPKGFPFEASASGTARRGQPSRHDVDLAGALPGSIRATVTMYPSALAAMTKGMDGMIREPGGCFEQTSATNYPNIMILGYLGSNDAVDAQLVAKTQGVLDKGYKLLTGYETPQKGYEWFGSAPGHEALTAYGLMEFADMGKVYDVDHRMVERTADWLMSRRDHKGGFQRSTQALDTFGRASETTTNAYIMWALAEAKRTKGLDVELATQKKLGDSTSDPYLLALAANTAILSARESAAPMVKHLAAMQGKDGSFAGAKESITMSGGQSLTIETTALAVLALIKASPNNEYEPQIRAGVDWINARRSGWGEWGNTQSTVLGLKALTAYTEHSKQMAAPGSATLVINGKDAGKIDFDKGRKEALVWDDVAKLLSPGKNTIEVRLDSAATLPYSIAIEYRAARPQSSDRAKVSVATSLVADKVKAGEGVTLRAHVENKTAGGIPMTLARVGIPGGLVFQTWQLKELRDKGLIDFYETRPREVIVYWRGLAPNAKKDVDLKLLASVPGTYEAPASSAYLYYTAEDKAWTTPLSVSIAR